SSSARSGAAITARTSGCRSSPSPATARLSWSSCARCRRQSGRATSALLDERHGIWKRLALGAVLIALASASATGVAAFHEIDKVVNAFKHGHTINLPTELAQADTGKPQTILLIGADQRARGAVDFTARATP